MLNYAELAREFADRGYLIIGEFFSSAKIADIEQRLQQYIKRIDPADSAGLVIYEPNTDGKIRNLFEMENQDQYFADLARTPELNQLAATIFDDEPILIGVELFGKPAR